jgi:hypothetical protein
MKLFETMLDIVLLPVAVAKDVVLAPIKMMDPFDNGGKSETRKQVEKIDEDINE